MDNTEARQCQPEEYHSVHRGLCDATADKVCREKIEALCCKAFIFVEREFPFGTNKSFTESRAKNYSNLKTLDILYNIV